MVGLRLVLELRRAELLHPAAAWPGRREAVVQVLLQAAALRAAVVLQVVAARGGPPREELQRAAALHAAVLGPMVLLWGLLVLVLVLQLGLVGGLVGSVRRLAPYGAVDTARGGCHLCSWEGS